jgi:hypothetical protein
MRLGFAPLWRKLAQPFTAVVWGPWLTACCSWQRRARHLLDLAGALAALAFGIEAARGVRDRWL